MLFPLDLFNSSPVDRVADDAEHLLNVFPLGFERSRLGNLKKDYILKETIKKNQPVKGLPQQLVAPVTGFPQVC